MLKNHIQYACSSRQKSKVFPVVTTGIAEKDSSKSRKQHINDNGISSCKNNISQLSGSNEATSTKGDDDTYIHQNDLSQQSDETCGEPCDGDMGKYAYESDRYQQMTNRVISQNKGSKHHVCSMCAILCGFLYFILQDLRMHRKDHVEETKTSL